jgi:hypothetical protein
MLQSEVVIELATERIHMERVRMFSDDALQMPVESPTRSSPKPHALSAMSEQESSEGDNFYGVQHAYGKSGSGDPTRRMQDVIDKSVSYQRRNEQRVRFDSAASDVAKPSENPVCFAYALEPSSCKYGATCKYRHLDAEKDSKQLLAHFRAQAKAKPSNRSHSIDSVDDLGDNASSDMSLDYDHGKED